jgi:dienelactone hydrolase
MTFRFILLCGFVLALCSVTTALAQKPTASGKHDLPDGFLFERHTTNDRHQRTITFYLSKLPKDSDTSIKRPVLLFICGSGCQSIFTRVGEKVSAGLPGLMWNCCEGKARVLVVEKPGVNCFDDGERPGSALGASDEFLKEHTLDRWVEANRAALRASWLLPGIDSKKSAVVGHSEGAGVAARMAAEVPEVTHVVCLAGGGPPQLFDLADLAAKRAEKEKPGTGHSAREKVYSEWKTVLDDPDSTTKWWLGHPHRRWSTFGTASQSDDLLKSKAKIFLAHGTEDQSVSVTAFDVCVATLLAKGRALTMERIEGGDHGLAKPGDKPAEGLKRVFSQLAKWLED